MKIGFVGLWHLGSVMSAVFAAAGHDVVAFDEPDRVAELRRLELPVAEPDLRPLIEHEVAVGRLSFTDRASDLSACELLWLTYDTPIREDGSANVASVLDAITDVLPNLSMGTLVVVSSQLPIGSIRELETRAATTCPERRLRFASSPENLRLGKAIEYMRAPDRYVIGVRNSTDAGEIKRALAPLSTSVEVMSVESAEMTKHALNAFLATSVSFVNEIAALCERTGADAREVERGLKTDMRIGPRAYLRAGGPFSGTTLARDIRFLIAAEEGVGLDPLMFRGVRDANDYHGSWSQRSFCEHVGNPRGTRVGILGLTYKPGTNTLRGSNAISLAKWLSAEGATVLAFDPAIDRLADDLAGKISLKTSMRDALEGVDALFVMTQWPEFLELTATDVFSNVRGRIVFDAERFLESTLGADARLRYFAIGMQRRDPVAYS